MILVHVEVERNIKTVAEDRHNRKKGVIVVELDQFRYKISGFEKPMEQIKKSLDLENKKKRIEELEADMEAPGFWDNTEKSQHPMKELKTLKSSFEKYNELEQGLEDAKTLIEMADEENDASLIPEVENEINSFEEKLENLRIETLLSGEYDKDNAILTLHAGAGEQRPATGVRCFSECIQDGQRLTDIQHRLLIILKVRKPELSL